jgi:molecular chaperone GrpE
VAKERDDMYASALETIVGQLLPVVDNMERASAAFKNDKLDEKYISGVEMVCKQLIDVLEKNGVKEIEALGKEFDPNIHHAVMQEPGEEDEENKVKEVFQKGYTLGNKVIRPTLVKVSVKQ